MVALFPSHGCESTSTIMRLPTEAHTHDLDKRHGASLPAVDVGHKAGFNEALKSS